MNWLALAALWGGICIGFIIGCWWAGACRLNDLTDALIEKEHQKRGENNG